MGKRHSFAFGLLALLVATCVWLPCLHLVYAHAPDARPLRNRQLALIDDPAAGDVARAAAVAANPEWDLMSRTFVAWALANWALREPAQTERALHAIDKTITGIRDIESARGFRAFLLPYGKPRFSVEPGRSLFVDSQIGLTLALRRLVRDDDAELRRLSRERTAILTERLTQARIGLAESYPDEGWSFDHAVALAALAAADRIDGTDHHVVIARVLSVMKTRLIDPKSGLLVSSFRLDGKHLDGPEGSSLWMTLHCLSLIDPSFAQAQYRRARAELGVSFLGFGWAREWPKSLRGERDIDSGAVVPLIDASAGSSGLAFVGAASFGDTAFLRGLYTTLEMAAFPVDDSRGRSYAASNQVGDAVLLYALELGPAWEKLGWRRP
jgi:hypothetical protein